MKVGASERRPVTARDTEEAVRKLNGTGHVERTWADGESVYTCVQGTNADFIAMVARLYLKKGDRLADITFGRGVFWQNINLSHYQFCKSDKITWAGSSHDFRKLPYPNRHFDVVVFDPPYARNADTMRQSLVTTMPARLAGFATGKSWDCIGRVWPRENESLKQEERFG